MDWQKMQMDLAGHPSFTWDLLMKAEVAVD